MSASNLQKGNNVPAGIGWMILTGLLFALVTTVVRYLGSDIPASVAAFIRYSIGLLIVLPSLTLIGRTSATITDIGLFVSRGLVHGLAVFFWFFAMARIPMAEVTAIGYTAPLFVTVGAALFFGERLYIRRLTALGLGFIGTLIILRPGFVELGIGQLAQLTAAPLFAASFLLAKKLTQRFSSATIVAVLTFSCSLVLLPPALYQWQTPDLREFGWLAATAVLATLGHYALTRAFQCAPITITQPVGLLQLVWAAMIGMIAFGEPIDPFVVAGSTLIVVAATYISYREAYGGRKVQTPPSAATES